MADDETRRKEEIGNRSNRRGFMRTATAGAGWTALLSAAGSARIRGDGSESPPVARPEKAAVDPGELFQTPVFVAGQEGYHAFRIPAILCTSKGTLLAFCEGRKDGSGDHGDVRLLLKRSEDSGTTWGPIEVVHEEGGEKPITIGNPCPVLDHHTGVIWLPFTRDNDAVLMTKSADDGRSWAAPVGITQAVKPPAWTWYATGPGTGIQLEGGVHAGRLIIPCDHREVEAGREVRKSHCFYSDDQGRSWKLGASVAPHTDECQVVELAGGRVLINMRNYWGQDGGDPAKGGRRAIAWSEDGTKSWSDIAFDDTLIEPVCQASILRYTTGRKHDANRILFSNPASKTGRVRMTVRMSLDEGASWPVSRVLHEGLSAYSCLVTLPDMRIGCLYERGELRRYENITFARFTRAWLESGPAQSTAG